MSTMNVQTRPLTNERIEQFRDWIGEQFSRADDRAMNGDRNQWQRAQAYEYVMLKFQELFPEDESEAQR